MKNFEQSWKVSGETTLKLEERYETSHVNIPIGRTCKSMNDGEITSKDAVGRSKQIHECWWNLTQIEDYI